MKSIYKTTISRHRPDRKVEVEDQLAVEEPMEIQLSYGPENDRTQQSISITMRTPGHDFELAVGFLYTEGILSKKEEVRHIRYAETWFGEISENTVLVELEPYVEVDLERLKRHFYTTSSCGVCGKASINAVHNLDLPKINSKQPIVAASVLVQLPDILRQSQQLFQDTGGIHAAGLFAPSGQLVFSREDVGRHNAVDKVVGTALQQGILPLEDSLILVSGRASFELIQKSLKAGIPMLAAVGAPSSLALQLAQTYGMTLVGFLKKEQFNVYCGEWRLST